MDGRCHVFHPLQTVKRGIRLHQDRLDFRIQVLQSPARPHERARGAGARHEMSHAMIGLFPDLHCRPLEVGLPVGVVVVLVGVKILFRMFGHQSPALVVSAVRTFQRVGFDDLRAVKPHQFLALFRGIGGETQRHLVAQRGSQRGISDPRIAAGRVDDGLVVSQKTAGDPVQDHCLCRPVLHRAGRVEILRLRIQLHAVQLPADRGQFQERRPADRFEYRLSRLHHAPASSNHYHYSNVYSQ